MYKHNIKALSIYWQALEEKHINAEKLTNKQTSEQSNNNNNNLINTNLSCY
jgi:hypothetical protein